MFEQVLGGFQVESQNFGGDRHRRCVNSRPGAWIRRCGGERIAELFGTHAGQGRVDGGCALGAEHGVVPVGVGGVEGDIPAGSTCSVGGVVCTSITCAVRVLAIGVHERVTASGAILTDERPTGGVHATRQVAGQNPLRHVLPVRERGKRPVGEGVNIGGAVGIFGECFRQFSDGRSARVRIVVRHNRCGVGVQGRRLGDSVQVRSAAAEGQVGVHKRFESPTEFGGWFAYSLGDGVGDSAIAGEHDDDAVGFAEFLGAEDEGGIAPGAGFAHGCLRSRYMLGGVRGGCSAGSLRMPGRR